MRECSPGVRKVMGSIPFGDSDFSLSHVRVMLVSSLLTREIKLINEQTTK